MSEELIQQHIERANQVLHRARMVNPAQYSHGINSGISRIEFCLRKLNEAAVPSVRFSNARFVYEETLKLAGYLFALQEKI